MAQNSQIEKQKRAQLRRRGWSEARIAQYMKDWRFRIPWSTNPRSKQEQKNDKQL